MKRKGRLVKAAVALSLAILAGIARADDAQVALLRSGVTELAFGKAVPGALAVTGTNAFPVVEAPDGTVIGAAGALGKSRVVAFSHGAFLKGGIFENESGSRLVLNCVRWAGKGMNARVGVAPGLETLAEHLESKGIEVRVMGPGEVATDLVDVYCVSGNDEWPAGEVAVTRLYLERGGGLVVAATPWAFAKKYPDFEKDFPGNRLIEGSGIEFLAKGTAKTGETLALTPSGGAVNPKTAESAGSTVREADLPAPVRAARSLTAGGRTMPQAEQRKAIAEMQKGLDLPAKDAVLLRDALAELDEAIGPVIPTKEEPLVKGADELRWTLVTLRDHLAMTLPASEVRPIAAGSEYPGPVPANAERVTEAITIDTSPKLGIGGGPSNYLVSTGFYAAPGELVKVTVPAKIAGAGFKVRVGAYHISLIDRKDALHRYPRLMRDYEIEERVTEVANALGGIITINVPRGFDGGELEIGIEGAVRAPYYEHGVTDVAEWKATIRDYPAPWAELASSRVVLTMPSSYIRNLSNPDELMALWDTILDSAAELLVIDRDRIRPERIVCERQLGLGSMHSGYPIGTHTGSFPEIAVDAKRLRAEGSWGIFHEIGHNHQRPAWFLPGTTETTCNLWSLYVYEKVIGKKSDDTHGAVKPFNRRQKLSAYISGGRNFERDWNVWTALETYMQLQEAFGWEAYKKVFDEYNGLEGDARPSVQQEKNDQWMVRFSKAVDRNLGPFFVAWNIPVTEKALEEIAGLPEWEEDPMGK